jgi:hypothetical protein
MDPASIKVSSCEAQAASRRYRNSPSRVKVLELLLIQLRDFGRCESLIHRFAYRALSRTVGGTRRSGGLVDSDGSAADEEE